MERDMSEEVMDKIFIPFFSTKKNRKRYRTKFMQTDYDAAQRKYYCAIKGG